MSQHPEYPCDRAPAGWFCTRARDHEGPCAAIRLAPAPLAPLPDPRELTCCHATNLSTGAICHDSKHHDGPHDWQRATVGA